MSEFISGKEALIALANGESVEFNHGSHGWVNCLGLNVEQILGSMFQMRLKPRTVNLNGVEVGQLKTAVWCISYPKEVNLEFKTEDDAHHFHANALKIFNGA